MRKNKKNLLIVVLLLSFLCFPGLLLATETTTTTTSVVDSITLSGEGADISWEVDGYSAKGFKVVWSKNSGPTYPLRSGDKYHYYTDPYKEDDSLTAFSGDGTYYVRVCEYLGGKCGLYSNQITVVLGDSESDVSAQSSDVVESITLSGEGADISWEVDGYSAKGFKVVWSKNSEPTYPLRSGDKYHYYTDPYKEDDSLTAFSGDGTYYVRVCEYLGGKCGLYSNQITVVLGDGTEDDAEQKICTMEYDPVCGKDGKTYGNKCTLEAAGVAKAYYGECKETEDSTVDSIKLYTDGTTVKWEVDGYSEKGFKVVWSKNSAPTYPLRSGDKYNYYSDPNYYYDKKLTAFDGDGTYYVRVCEYLGGKCGVYSNEVNVELTRDVDIAKIDDKASKLANNQLDEILSELKQLRNLVLEQQNEIKYLKGLVSDMSAITEVMQSSINSFITYGVDENTEKLGEGERAAVMYSFKSAYGRLPEDEDELADAIKIANGRWPSMTSEEAEENAKEKFREIYKRDPEEDNANDQAAIVIMAYGLRQKAENRNLDSERAGIQIFKNIFGHVPETTEDWNVMQAITYSGASR